MNYDVNFTKIAPYRSGVIGTNIKFYNV